MGADARGMGQLLAGKVALVTGGGTGIGEATCKLFAAAGADVVVNGLPDDPVDAVVDEIRRAGGGAVAHKSDIGVLEGARGAVVAAVTAFGRLDVLVANAGLFPEMAELSEFPLERFEDLLHVNVVGVYLTVRAALPEL